MTLPGFGLGAAGLLLALARGVWLIGLLSAAGALVFRALEPAMPATLAGRVMRLILASLALALLAWLAWAALAGDRAVGRLAVAQIGLLATSALALRWGRWLPAMPALAAVVLQVGELRASLLQAMPALLLAAILLHLLAAAVWLGGLLPLRIVVRHSAPAHAAAAMRRFWGRERPCVLMIAASSALLGFAIPGGLPGLAHTAYGWVATGKLVLYAVLVAFTLRHRYRLTRKLANPEPRAAHGALVASLAVQAGFGVVLVLASALLSGLPPGMPILPPG